MNLGIENEMEERRKSIQEYVDSLSNEEVRKELINKNDLRCLFRI